MLACLTFVTVTLATDTLTCVNDTILEYSENRKPFVFAGQMSAPYDIFTGTLGISSAYNSKNKVLVLFNSEKILTFDISSSTIKDESLKSYSGSAFFRGDVLYVPLETVCSVFGLNYSTFTSKATVVRVTNNQAILSNEVFKTYVDLEIENKTEEKVEIETQADEKNDELIYLEETQEQSVIVLKTINPIFLSNISKTIIDRFYKNQITFFVDDSTFEDTETLRYASIKNQSIGIYVDANNANSYEEVLEYIKTTNKKLFKIIGDTTRILTFEKSIIGFKQDLENQGYIIVEIEENGFDEDRLLSKTRSSTKLQITSQNQISKLINFANSEKINFISITEIN